MNGLDSENLKAAAASYRELVYQGAVDAPIELPNGVSVGMGYNSRIEIKNALCAVMDQAKINCLSPKGQKRMQQTLKEFMDVFEIKLGPDPSTSLTRFLANLKKNARPNTLSQHQYAPTKRAFSHAVQKLEKDGAFSTKA